MTSSSARATSTVEWVIQPVSVSSLTLTVARLRVGLYFATDSSGPPNLLEPAWLDTGLPRSVIPFHVQKNGVRYGSPSPALRSPGPANDAIWVGLTVWLSTD